MNKVSKTTLGNLIEFQRGYDLPKSQFVDGIYPVQSSNGILGYHNEYKVKAPGITIGRSGTVGLPHLIKTDFFPHNTALFIKDFKGNNVEYIFYLLRNLKLGDKKSGSGVPTMNRNHLHPLNIQAHLDLPTQKQIAKVLSDLDAKIELNNKINRELEAMAKTLYDYWFVQFDFPANLQDSALSGAEGYKSSGGKMVYNEELKREIPEGWVAGTIDDIANLVRGVSYNKDDIKSINDNGTIPILRATNITGNTIDLENMVYVSEEFASEQQSLSKYDILITMSSGSKEHIGKNGFYYFDDKVAFGAFCAKLVGKNNYHFYLYSYTQSEFMSATIKNECLGTNINNLNGSLVKGFKLPIPSNKILKKFNKSVSNLYERIANNTKQNQKLTELRDWLLPMLMNGQITIRQAHGSAVGEAKEKLNSSA